MRLTSSYIRSTAGRTIMVCAGVAAVAAAAFTAVGTYAAAPTVQIAGQNPVARPGRLYEILVRSPRSAGESSDGTTLTRPADLTEISGGITLGQYDAIRGLPGVLVAAPLTWVGYAAAPFGSIRVRVAGTSTGNAVGQERIRAVATEIVRATGLRVDVVFGTAAVARSVDLATHPHGRPALHVREIWYRTERQTTVTTALDPGRSTLAVLVLLIGAAFAANGGVAAQRARRRELMTLRALGWPRRQLSQQILAEFALMAMASGLAGVVTAVAAEAFLGRSWLSPWTLVAMPSAFAMTIAGACWPVRMGRPQRSAKHTVPAVLVIVLACSAVGGELTVRWAFGGMLVGLWLGRPVSVAADAVGVLAVVMIVVIATVTLCALDWLSARERADELRTLKAIGWPARGVARRVTMRATPRGLAGGIAAAVVDVSGTLVLTHQISAGLVAAAAVTVGVGLLLSLTSAGLSAVISHPARMLS